MVEVARSRISVTRFYKCYHTGIPILHCVYVKMIRTFGRIYLTSIYFQCAEIVKLHVRKIERIMSILSGEKIIISANDVSARSHFWHCRSPERRD